MQLVQYRFQIKILIFFLLIQILNFPIRNFLPHTSTKNYTVHTKNENELKRELRSRSSHGGSDSHEEGSGEEEADGEHHDG